MVDKFAKIWNFFLMCSFLWFSFFLWKYIHGPLFIRINKYVLYNNEKSMILCCEINKHGYPLIDMDSRFSEVSSTVVNAVAVVSSMVLRMLSALLARSTSQDMIWTILPYGSFTASHLPSLYTHTVCLTLILTLQGNNLDYIF